MVSFIKVNTWIGGPRSPGTMGGKSQMWLTMCYGYHIWSEEPLMQVKNDDDLVGRSKVNRGQI